MPRVRKGKISRLPAELRAEINGKLHDNVMARVIAGWLESEHAAALKEAGVGTRLIQNICSWRRTGYADWERRQERLEEMRSQQEFALEIARQTDGSVQEANLALAASQICEILQEFDIQELQTKLREKPELYTALVGAIAKLSGVGLGERKLQLELTKYRDKVAQEKEKIQRELGMAKAGGLTPEILARIEEALNLL